MVELRWVERSVPITPAFYSIERVLQYRNRIDQNTATNWQDVPLASEAETGNIGDVK